MTVGIPAWKAGVSPSYDISWNNGKYNVLADRTSKSVDIVNDATYAFTQVGGFTGFTGRNDTSGPDGVVYDSTHDLFYVGDVNKVVVVNANTASVVATVPINAPGSTAGSGLRTDEGCYDPDDHIMAMTNNADAPPFTTFINTDTNKVIAQYTFPPSSVGAEQCWYLTSTKSFYTNDVGSDTVAVPNGQNPPPTTGPFPAAAADAVGGGLVQITAASVKAGAPVVANEYSETVSFNGQTIGCNPAGLIGNTAGNMLVGCGDVSSSQNAFAPSDPGYTEASQIYGPNKYLHSLVMSPAGQVLSIVPYGGSDEVNYDPSHNRFYAAARFWTSTGLTGGTPLTSIGVIDGASYKLLGIIPTVGNVHSVAADPITGNLYVPQQSTSTASGGVQIYTY